MDNVIKNYCDKWHMMIETEDDRLKISEYYKYIFQPYNKKTCIFLWKYNIFDN